jgi:DNA-binding NarL/FixJ family response regulator
MIRVLVADDHPVVRRGLRQILADQPDMAVGGEARDAQEALDLVRAQAWDAVILDISLPGRSGLEALGEIRQARPRLPVLVLSMHPEEQFAVRVLKAGGPGYLTKDAAPEELPTAIRRIVSGGKYISASLAERLAFDLEAGRDRPPPRSAVGPRVPGPAPDRLRQDRRPDRPPAVAQRQDGQHLPNAGAREDGPPDERAAHALRHPQPPRRLIGRGPRVYESVVAGV